MDTTLIGIISTTIVAVVSIVLTHYFSLKRERDQWQRQQEAEQEKVNREERKVEQERLRQEKGRVHEIYLNSIQCLAALSAYENTKENEEERFQITGEGRAQLIKEAHRWLALLALRHHTRDDSFQNSLEAFTKFPDGYRNAWELKEEVVNLYQADKEIAAQAKGKSKKPEEKEIGGITIRFNIDEDFRREQLVDSVILPASYTFSYNISKLTTTQRKKLVDSYFELLKKIPEEVHLPIPAYHERDKHIKLTHRYWQARLNPNTTSPEDVLKAWEKAFEEALSEAQAKLPKQDDK